MVENIIKNDPQVVIVTGCNGGIGQSICNRLNDQGFNVIGLDLSKKSFCSASDPVIYQYYQVNLSDNEQLQKCLGTIRQSFGEILYGLVNNAGRYDALDFLTTNQGQYENIMSINVCVPFYISQWFARTLIRLNHPGCIVNIASVSGESGSKDVVYAASKGALISMSKSLAMALAPKIRVNSVSPGIIETPMSAKIPAERIVEYEKRILNQRLGQPDDIANAVAFLLNKESNYINGTNLSVNGGLH